MEKVEMDIEYKMYWFKKDKYHTFKTHKMYDKPPLLVK